MITNPRLRDFYAKMSADQSVEPEEADSPFSSSIILDQENTQNYREVDVPALDIDKDGPSEELDVVCFERLSDGFGQGVSKRKILVTKGVTLKQLVEMSKD